MNDEDDFDMVAFMHCQSQMMNELILKRTQVQQLRKQLDVADAKAFELSRKLEESNRAKSDLEVTSKRVKELEDKLRERKESKAQSQFKTLTDETNMLKDMLEKGHIENKNLLRTIEDLNLQHQNDTLYRKELIQEDIKIRSIIARCTETMEKLENDSKLLEVLNTMELCDKQQKALEFYTNKIKCIKEENEVLEDKFIKCNAKLETLESLIESYPLPQKNSSAFNDETARIIENLRDEVGQQQEQMQIFMVKLKAEVAANTQFIQRDEAMMHEIEELKQKLTLNDRSVIETSTQTDETVLLKEVNMENDNFIIEY